MKWRRSRGLTMHSRFSAKHFMLWSCIEISKKHYCLQWLISGLTKPFRSFEHCRLRRRTSHEMTCLFFQRRYQILCFSVVSRTGLSSHKKETQNSIFVTPLESRILALPFSSKMVGFRSATMVLYYCAFQTTVFVNFRSLS